MTRLCAITTLIALLACANAEADQGKKKKKQEKPIAGTITEIKKSQGKEEGTITIAVQAKKNKKNTAPAPATPESKIIKVTAETKVLKRGKKQAQPEALKFSNLEKDQQITVKVKGDTAEEIKAAAKKKAAKKKAA